MKFIINKKTGDSHCVSSSQDFHCKHGILSKEDLESDKITIVSSLNKEFFKSEANQIDMIRKLKRGPQLMNPKDLGYIISRTRVGKHSKIVEAGAGMGVATSFFANIAKKVHSYEIREDHLELVRKNLEILGIQEGEDKDVFLQLGDLADFIEKEENVDLLFLDMPNPIPVLEKNLSGINSGKYIVCYLPSITQLQELSSLIEQKEELYLEEITEVIIRHWKVWGTVSRPEHRKEIDHTAFLAFIRKL